MPTAEAAPPVPQSVSASQAPIDIAALKARLRAAAVAAREQAAAEAPRAGLAVCDQFLAAVPIAPAAVVSGYWPIGSELDVRPLLSYLAALGHVCALPVVVGRGQALLFRQWVPGTALVGARFGLSVPPAAAPEVRPTVLLVPLLAFDLAGRRVGYGAGFYDRTLERLRGAGDALAVGVALAAQQVDAVPVSDRDQPLDWVVTERFARRVG